MQRLWAPWRIKYILSPKDKNCFICEAIKHPEKDEENFVLFRGKHTITLLNLYPYNNGHLMIAPFDHDVLYEDLKPETIHEIGLISQKTIKIFKQVFMPDAFNLGYNFGQVAGAGLKDHVHFHVVPRWNGDTNFMPVVNDVRVISEGLHDTYKKLIDKFNGEIFNER